MRALQTPSREDLTKRLKRAEGHLKATIGYVLAKRPALELAQQLQACEAAIGTAKQQLIHEQVAACLEGAESNAPVVRELKRLSRYL